MPDGDLRQLAEVKGISTGFTRPDGSTGSTPVCACWRVAATAQPRSLPALAWPGSRDG
jgi:hypothetical protein